MPKTRNIHLEEKQIGMWWWVTSKEERSKRGKHVLQHEAFFPEMDLESWAWLAPGPISRREKNWTVIALYFLLVSTPE